MFDENFSFLSSTVSSPAAFRAAEHNSSDVSPFSSRCPSPLLQARRPSLPMPPCRQQPDARFFRSSYTTPRHPSVVTLTAQLENIHVISSNTSSSAGSESSSITSSPVAAPTSSLGPDLLDEGFAEPPLSPLSDLDLPPWNLSMGDDLSPTSCPSTSSLSPQFALRRRQRQQLVRLQCMARCAPDLMMLVEECHPSSMPLPSEASWATSSKRTGSVASLGRIEKDRLSGASVRKVQMPRIRKRNTR